MPKSDEAFSENLNGEQERTLIALLNLIIPPDADGRMPGAGDVGFVAYMHQEHVLPWVRDALLSIVEESHNSYGREFAALSEPEQMQIFDRLRRKHSRLFGNLTTQVIQCYYQNDQVLTAIGLEARTPFPQGYLVEEGDLTLLEPVYQRGRLYRD